MNTTKTQITIQDIIAELGLPPVCDCDECQKIGKRVNISVANYKRYKRDGYPRYLTGHHMLGKTRPEHSKLMTGKGNLMYGNPREDLQVKFKGSGNPMYGKIGWNKGQHWSEEVKAKLRKPKTEECKQKISKTRIEKGIAKGEKHPFYGKHHTEETKEHLRIINRGKKDSIETREKKRLASLEMWQDEEFKVKMCKINAEVRNRPEIKENHSEFMKNNNPMYDPNVRLKLSEIQQELWSFPLYREKLLKAFEGRWTQDVRAKVTGKNSCWYGKQVPHPKKIYEKLTPYQGIVKMFRWEYLFSKYLDSINEPYYYELSTFPISINEKDTTYTPDFYIPDTDMYIEIKRVFRGNSEQKTEIFKQIYPNYNYVIWFEKNLKDLDIDLRMTKYDKDFLRKYKEEKQKNKQNKNFESSQQIPQIENNILQISSMEVT